MRKGITYLFCLLSFALSAQEKLDNHIKVLEDDVVGKTFTFGAWSEKGSTETHIKYLGIIEETETTYKILVSTWIWGQSRRATNRVFVFDSSNCIIGDYYVGMTYQLPTLITENKLHFKADCQSCEADNFISFDNEIPATLFIECKDGYGDILSFTKYVPD